MKLRLRLVGWLSHLQDALGLLTLGAWISLIAVDSADLLIIALCLLASLVTIALFRERPASIPAPTDGHPEPPPSPPPPMPPPAPPRPPDSPVLAPLRPRPVLGAGAAKMLPRELDQKKEPAKRLNNRGTPAAGRRVPSAWVETAETYRSGSIPSPRNGATVGTTARESTAT